MPRDLASPVRRTGACVFVLEREVRSYRPSPRAFPVDDDFLGLAIMYVVFNH